MTSIDDVRPQFAVQTRDAGSMRTALAEITQADPSELTDNYAGQQIEIFELSLAATFFCGDHQIPKVRVSLWRKIEPELAVMLAMVPEDQHERLAKLVKMLAEQIAGS